MIKEDLVAERIAIDSYRDMVNYFGNDDPTTRRLMETILAMEEEHADDLGSLLEEFGARAVDISLFLYEGAVNQCLGDGFMALFGAPVAHEKHARRAVQAALGLQRRLRGRGSQPLQPASRSTENRWPCLPYWCIVAAVSRSHSVMPCDVSDANLHLCRRAGTGRRQRREGYGRRA